MLVLLDGYGGWHNEFGVRPIVSLKPQIKNLQVTKATTQEPAWSGKTGHSLYVEPAAGIVEP